MKKYLLVFFILLLVFSLETFAKDAFSFEPYEYADSVLPSTDYEGMAPFITGYRDAKPEDFSIVEGVKWWHGTHSIQMCMTHTGTRWNIMAKNLLVGSQPENLDTTFLDGLDNGDTTYYYVYIPWNAPIDSIFIFVRNASWAHDLHTVYYPSDLRYGRWNELKDGISDDLDISDGLIQSDFEVHTNPEVNPPACTLYIDAISSKGRVPRKYVDTTGQAGIDEDGPNIGLVNISGSSINCVQYELAVGAPVMVSVYDLTGSKKKLEMPIGVQPSGTYNIPVDLSPGVYVARVATDKEVVTSKVICLK